MNAAVQALDGMSEQELRILNARIAWRKTARVKQLPPDQWTKGFKYKGVTGPRDWLTWGIRSGRGFGKTRAGAEWLWSEAVDDPGSYSFVIAPTYSDARYTCFEGVSGLLSCIPPELVLSYDKGDLILSLWTGGKPAQIRGFSADTPERLRGPQSGRGWLDELAAWRYPQETWDMFMFGLRLGTKPRICWTSTLKPKPFIVNLLKDKAPTTIVTQGSTYDNAKNLAAPYLEQLMKYKGTALGRQELEGELLDPTESGIVKRSQFRIWPRKKPLPMFEFVIYSLDTAFTEKTFDKKEVKADPTACSVWGVFSLDDGTKHAMLLDCWDEHLGLSALIERVRKERGFHYGASIRIAGEGTYLKPAKMLAGSGRTPDLILIEDKGSGISLRQMLARENILTHPYNPGRADKLSRLHAVTPMFAHGRVWCIESETLPGEPKSWAEALMLQVCSYTGPGSTEHDDYVDATSQALRYIMDVLKIQFVAQDKKQRDDDKPQSPTTKIRKNAYG